MEFPEKLDSYLNALGCSNKKFARLSGLSEATVSRYRKGERVPSKNSEQVEKLARGISGYVSQAPSTPDKPALADQLAPTADIASGQPAPATPAAASAKLAPAVTSATPAAPTAAQPVADTQPVLDFSYAAVYEALNNVARTGDTRDSFCDNFNALISLLKVNVNDLARSLNYDASYISRIRNHKRRPQNMEAFANGVSGYVVQRYTDAGVLRDLSKLIGCPEESFRDARSYSATLERWLCSGELSRPDHVGDFLKMLDRFDLTEYTSSIQFDEMRLPATPQATADSKSYYGLGELRQGELDFLEAVAVSPSADDVFMYSGMPMEDMADDLGFYKKWMFGVALMLKKGLNLSMVHNLDRPFDEMMLGLLTWVPIYMTGQVSPYCFSGAPSTIYSHLDYVSGEVALHGDCVVGYHEHARYQLTREPRDLAYCKTKAADLLAKARPLMDIYREDSAAGYSAFLATSQKTPGARRNILANLPLYILPEQALLGILERNGIAQAEQAEILQLAATQKETMEAILAENTITDEIALLDEEEFAANPLALALSDIFYREDVSCTFEEYTAFLERMRGYAAEHKNYSYKMTAGVGFRNIQIEICEGAWAKVSKSKSPAIHFVIKHPQLRAALANIVFPVID